MIDDATSLLREIHANIMSLHGDVKVALDRTESHDKRIGTLEGTQTDQGKEIARAKGFAVAIGGSGGIIGWLLAEIGSRLFGVHH